jgi:hypothetical protein
VAMGQEDGGVLGAEIPARRVRRKRSAKEAKNKQTERDEYSLIDH